MDMAEVHAKSAYKMVIKAIRSIKKVAKDLEKINKTLLC